MQRGPFLAMLAIVILVPIALGAAYALTPSGDSVPATGATTEATSAAESMKATVKGVTAAHRLARAKCERLVGADRGNCRSEARAEARRALKTAQGMGPPA